MYVDYRKVNVCYYEKFPNIDEIFDSQGSTKIFTTLDLCTGYHQILMDEKSVEVKSFTSKFGN